MLIKEIAGPNNIETGIIEKSTRKYVFNKLVLLSWFLVFEITLNKYINWLFYLFSRFNILFNTISSLENFLIASIYSDVLVFAVLLPQSGEYVHE